MSEIKRVVLFGIDGAGTFFEQAETPNMDRIFKNGAVSRRTLTELPSISGQCWGSMLHGVECARHGLTNSIADTVPYPIDSPYPSVFRVIREAMPDAKLASFSDWGSINVGIIEDGIDVYKYHAADHALIDPAIEYINNNDFTLLFFQFDSVDGAGHGNGYGTEGHLNAITKNDEYIGRIVDAIEKRGWMDDTLFLVEADHGGIGHGHGGASDEEKWVNFYAAGGNVRNTELTDMMVRDTSSIILHALGIPQPEGWTGRVPGGLFPDCMETLPRPEGIPVPGKANKREQMEEKNEFLNSFADFEPLVYVPFENDAALPEGTEKHGKLYTVDGLRGQGMRFDDGFLTIPCPSLEEGFTLMGWVCIDNVGRTKEGIITALGSSFMESDNKSGISINVSSEYIRIRAKEFTKESHKGIDSLRAVEAAGNWIFFALYVDTVNKKAGVSLDFAPFDNWDIRDEISLPESNVLYIGQDEKADKCNRLAAVLDDFCLCRKVLDDADLKRLEVYYFMKNI